jgi:hypothetical protein
MVTSDHPRISESSLLGTVLERTIHPHATRTTMAIAYPIYRMTKTRSKFEQPLSITLLLKWNDRTEGVTQGRRLEIST